MTELKFGNLMDWYQDLKMVI